MPETQIVDYRHKKCATKMTHLYSVEALQDLKVDEYIGVTYVMSSTNIARQLFVIES